MTAADALGAKGPTSVSDPTGFREIRVPLPDVTLRVAYGPAHGDPLLLIHGVGRAWRDGVPLLPALMPRWSVVAPDLRGHGASAHTPGRYLIRDYLGDMIALLEQCGRPTVIYGHSLGALLGGLLAAQRPDLVRALIAEDPPSPAFLEKLSETAYSRIFRAMQSLAGTSRDVGALARQLAATVIREEGGRVVRFGDIRDGTAIRFSARWLCDLDPGVYTPILEQHWRDGLDFPEVWSRVVCPTLLLAGDETVGGMLPTADARDIMNRLPDGTLVEFPRVGHQIHWMAGEATTRVVLGFLESL
ncbi:MAG: alpha/beta hydrolase [Planctomycetes bacterium]|nr:alpha/beta hydrolase [Planctomycetota bacterium]